MEVPILPKIIILKVFDTFFQNIYNNLDENELIKMESCYILNFVVITAGGRLVAKID